MCSCNSSHSNFPLSRSRPLTKTRLLLLIAASIPPTRVTAPTLTGLTTAISRWRQWAAMRVVWLGMPVRTEVLSLDNPNLIMSEYRRWNLYPRIWWGSEFKSVKVDFEFLILLIWCTVRYFTCLKPVNNVELVTVGVFYRHTVSVYRAAHHCNFRPYTIYHND